jgi:6-pyruvoyltetrahydropterin/6-carboxytetrahydropterin synthase
VRVFAFHLEVALEGRVDEARGIVVNLARIKEVVRAGVAPLRGACLDGQEGRPRARTPEELARRLWGILAERFETEGFEGTRLARVRLLGDPSPIVDCHGGRGVAMDVTRVYEFCASHRLHSPALSAEENERLFGKCNRPGGHGHNYVLEVTVRGEPDEEGRVMPAELFDAVVEREVIEPWDHRNLNEGIADFAQRNPTAEEIARAAWRRLVAPLHEAAGGRAHLARITLRETARNYVEYCGEEE